MIASTMSYTILKSPVKARNDWAHKMREPESWEVYETIWAAQDLLLKIKGVRIQLSLTGPGPGVPEWYILKNHEEGSTLALLLSQ